MPSFSGSFGILPKHVPLLAVLKPGVVTVYENEGAAKKYFGMFLLNYDLIIFYLRQFTFSEQRYCYHQRRFVSASTG